MSAENSTSDDELAPAGPGTPSILDASTQDELQTGSSLSRSRLFVAGLPKNLTGAGLETLFSPYGEVVAAAVMLDVATGRSREFGFVHFTCDEDAARALTAMNNKSLDGMAPIHVAVARYTDTEQKLANEKLYVQNVPTHVSQRQLIALFSHYGAVKEAALFPVPSQTSKSGFVRFESVEDAKRAKAAVANTKPFGGEKAILLFFMENSVRRQCRP